MTLRREVLGPGPRRAPRNPIPLILGLLLIATFASAAMENRQLRRRAEAAEKERDAVAAKSETERLQREFDSLTEQIVEANAALREANGEAGRANAERRLNDAQRKLDHLRMGDFPLPRSRFGDLPAPPGDYATPARHDPWGASEPR